MLRRQHKPAAQDSPRQDASEAMVTVTDQSFEAFVGGGAAVIDFFAPWCGPCRQIAPIFDRLADQHGEALRFGRCDVDQNPRTAARLNIMSIPTIVLFDEQSHEIDRLIGAVGSRQLEDFLSAATRGAA